MAESAGIETLGSSPVPGPSPAGVSARYEPEFERLSGEIAKLESVEGRTSIRWGDVVDLSAAILSKKSKDLLVAGYLTLGLVRQKGYSGLAAGLRVCRDMIADFWDGLFPEKNRVRARAAALQWMSERVEAVVSGMPSPSKSDGEILSACSGLLGELGALVGEKFSEEAPDLGGLARAVQEKLGSIPPDEPAPVEAQAAEGAASGQAAAGAAAVEAPSVGDVSSPEAAREALGQICRSLWEVAGALRRSSPTDPLAYQLSRLAVWSDVVGPPPSEGGVAQVAGGDPDFAAGQEALLDKGEYSAVLEASEGRLASDSLWLDLNFFVYRAMEGLGRPYAAARKAVEDLVAWLVRRVPELLDLRFAGGVPMAGEAARLWIVSELGAQASKAAAGSGGRPMEGALAEARKLAARKEFDKAVGILQKLLQGLSTRRERFAGRLDLAKLCLEGGRPELARPQLEALDQEARRFPLEEWEPGLCVELATELVKCYSALSVPEKLEEAYGRLCRLDISAALALKLKR